jgi:hypothetical protein
MECFSLNILNERLAHRHLQDQALHPLNRESEERGGEEKRRREKRRERRTEPEVKERERDII